MKNIVIFLLVISSLLLGREIDAIAAVVGDSIILRSDVNAFVEMQVEASGKPADALMRNMLV